MFIPMFPLIPHLIQPGLDSRPMSMEECWFYLISFVLIGIFAYFFIPWIDSL